MFVILYENTVFWAYWILAISSRNTVFMDLLFPSNWTMFSFNTFFLKYMWRVKFGSRVCCLERITEPLHNTLKGDKKHEEDKMVDVKTVWIGRFKKWLICRRVDRGNPLRYTKCYDEQYLKYVIYSAQYF